MTIAIVNAPNGRLIKKHQRQDYETFSPVSIQIVLDRYCRLVLGCWHTTLSVNTPPIRGPATEATPYILPIRALCH